MRHEKLPNWQIAVYALHTLGGATQRIATEDVTLRCFEIAPDAFSWVKYPQYPDKDIVRSALVDARKPKNGALVQGRSGKGVGLHRTSALEPTPDGWSLTEAGARWVSLKEEDLAQQLRFRQASSHRQDIRQKLARIREHGVYLTFLEQPEGFTPSLGEMAELFRCRVDADWQIWEKRFNAAINMAESVRDSSVLEFVTKCKNSVRAQLGSP
jgi:hypothetical protein